MEKDKEQSTNRLINTLKGEFIGCKHQNKVTISRERDCLNQYRLGGAGIKSQDFADSAHSVKCLLRETPRADALEGTKRVGLFARSVSVTGG